MSKKGVSAASGISSPLVGQKNTYHIVSWYPGTSAESRDPKKVTWELFKKRSNGTFTSTKIKKTGDCDFTFGEIAAGETYRLEAYLYEPEGGGLIITPQPAKIPKINKVELFYVDDTKGSTFNFTEKLRARANCTNMLGKDVVFTLWEDDANGAGHQAANSAIDSKKAKVDDKGLAAVDFTLTSALMKKAAAGEKDAKLEFYVTVEYFKNKKHATENVNVNNPFPKPPVSKPASTPKLPATSTPAPAKPAEKPKAPDSPAAQKPPSQKEEKGIMDRISEAGSELWDWAESAGSAIMDKIPTILKPDGKSPAIVKAEHAVEGISDAYFAKKEFTKQTGEAAGTLEYSFGGDGNKTKTDAEKEKIAKIILGKPIVTALSKKKEYTTLQAIKDAFKNDVYNKSGKITFKTFKLGVDFKKVNSAPLDAKVYLVAKTYILDGKTATIIIKEKDGVIKGTADAVLPILEITEAEMEDTKTSTEMKGTEKSEFTATVKDGMVKIPVRLRPKSDDDLKTWKERLAKGKKDADYTYKFGSATTIADDKSKKRIAAIILKNAKAGNTNNKKFADGTTAFAEDIEKALATQKYEAGASIVFPTYKKLAELLYLNVKATGKKEHNKEFLKIEGAYFQIGKKCECEEKIRAFMRTIRVAEGTGEYVKGTKQARDPQLGYTTWFSGGGNNFTLSDDHPRVINSNSTNTLRSSAAGAYQFMSWKYDELNGFTVIFKNDYFQKAIPEVYTEASDKAKKYDAKGFSQIAQDRLCVIILKDIGAIAKLLNNDIRGAIAKSSGTWVSLPGATAGQPTAKMQETIDYYNEFLKEELAGKSHLHIQKGFLKDFDIKCSCGNESSDSWHHPLDRMELRGWYGSGFYPGDSDHGDAEVRISKNHEGLDLYAPIGTEVYACVDGEIYEDYVSTTYGNTLGIKGTYNGETYYFFYAHLSERSVAKGATVSVGDPIGKTGQTGNASGQAAKMNHLHFEVRNTSAKTGGRIDPLATIDELKTDVITNPDETTQTGI